MPSTSSPALLKLSMKPCLVLFCVHPAVLWTPLAILNDHVIIQRYFDSLSLMRERSLGDKLVEFQRWVMYISHIYVYTKIEIDSYHQKKLIKANRTRQNRVKYF